MTTKYEEYIKVRDEYRKKRKDLLKDPEEKLEEIADDLKLHAIREKAGASFKKMTDKAWRLYRKIYRGEPTRNDVKTFLSLCDEIMKQEDFLTVDNKKVWEVSRDLIWAFGESYQQKEIA